MPATFGAPNGPIKFAPGGTMQFAGDIPIIGACEMYPMLFENGL